MREDQCYYQPNPIFLHDYHSFSLFVWAYIHLGNEDDPKGAAKTTNGVVDREQKAHDPERSWATHISPSNEVNPHKMHREATTRGLGLSCNSTPIKERA